MVTTVIRHRHHTMPLHLAHQRRLREEVANETTIEGGELFDKAPNFIKSVDEEWVVNWLASQSSLTADEIVKARKADPEAPYQLLAFALQLGLHMRLPESCRTKAVLWRVFSERAAMCGNRLNDFKKRAPIDKAGRLCWQKGSYTLIWAEGRLGSIQHCGGEKVDVGDTYSKEYKLEFNWNDWDAQLGQVPRDQIALVLRRLAHRTVRPAAVVEQVQGVARLRQVCCRPVDRGAPEHARRGEGERLRCPCIAAGQGGAEGDELGEVSGQSEGVDGEAPQGPHCDFRVRLGRVYRLR